MQIIKPYEYFTLERETQASGERVYLTPDGPYYVYELIDPRSNQPFYVGKGKDDRWKDHGKETDHTTMNRHKFNVIQAIRSAGYEYAVKFVHINLDEETAYAIEEQLIEQYGRFHYDVDGILTNICISNRPPKAVHTPERREASRQRLLGNQLNNGRIRSEEENKRRAESLKEAYRTGRKKITTAEMQNSRKKAVEVNGVWYESITKAHKETGISEWLIRKMVK